MHLSTMIDWRHALLGVVLTLACSLAGQSLAALPGFSLIGHLVLALLLGMVIQVCRPVTLAARESTGFIANKFLRAGIIFLGFKLNLIVLVSAGLQSLEAAVFVVAIMIPLNYAASTTPWPCSRPVAAASAAPPPSWACPAPSRPRPTSPSWPSPS